jgi:Raf kinase inhibitor-like YbhB/YbcL family protein
MRPLFLIFYTFISLAVAGCHPLQPPVDFQPLRSGKLILTSSVATNGGVLPVEFTGDGASISPPLAWNGEPAETKCFAVIMHHIDPQGVTKWYWTLYNIPAGIHSLPKNARAIGTLGNNSVNRQPGYAPPHSKGPGPKTYILTVYALSNYVKIAVPAAEVSRAVLLKNMRNLVLDSAELRVTYDRTPFINRPDANQRP